MSSAHLARGCLLSVFFFNHPAPTEIYTLSYTTLFRSGRRYAVPQGRSRKRHVTDFGRPFTPCHRSEEHTSELQSRVDLVCRLLLEKKNVREWQVCRLSADIGSC